MACIVAVGNLDLKAQEGSFIEFARHRVNKEKGFDRISGKDLEDVCKFEKDGLSNRIFFEYGAIFVASSKVRIPPSCIFASASDVAAFQEKIKTKKNTIGTVEIELQAAAMENLLDAVAEAMRQRLKITPLDGAVAGSRSYEDTVRIWNSRFLRALDYWTRKGKITDQDADSARFAQTRDQIDKVIAWEEKGYYFSTNFSKSILYSVAPPGTSQHLSMLAFDVVEANDSRVRKILNQFGWYQTIRSDQPHFTFLGVTEAELPERGLRKVRYDGNDYWVPSHEAKNGPDIPVK